MSLLDEYQNVIKILAGEKHGSRIVIERALELLEKDEKPFYVIRAPTGYGKTAFTYTLAIHALKDASKFEKVVHVLPMRSIIQDIYDRASSFLFPFVGRQMMGAHEDPFLLRPLTLTTVDTFTYDFMKLNTMKIRAVKEGREYGYDYLTQASLALSAVVFDEAHSILEEQTMASAFLTVLNALLDLGTPVFLMTATISKGYASRMRREAERRGYSFKVLPEFNEVVEDDFFKREKMKNFKIELNEGRPENFLAEDKRNLIVLNTVKEAQETYLRLKEEGWEALLLHSRFTPKDRGRLMTKLENMKSREKWVIVATQVVEAGIDLSSDILITEISPPTSLIQRMGRNARFDEQEGEIHILKRESCPPYDKRICENTLKGLERMGNPVNMHPRDPSTYQELLDTVYPIVGGSPYGTLLSYILDPMVRSDEMREFLDSMIRRGQDFLREYPVSLMLGEDPVPVTRYLLEILVKKMPGSVLICSKKGCKEATGLNDVRKAVRDIALWEDVEIRLRDDLVEKMYDEEVGLRVDMPLI